MLLSAADDHRWLSSQRVEYVVCDEADRLFEMGFAAQLDAILQSVPPTRQTLLFSATMPALLADFTRANLHDPQLIRLGARLVVSHALSCPLMVFDGLCSQTWTPKCRTHSRYTFCACGHRRSSARSWSSSGR